MELKTYFAQDASGNIMPGATVMVYEAATTTLATGLQDESGSPLANPFTADSSAKVSFYAPDGLYDITVVGNGRTVTIRAQFVSVDGASVLRSDLAAPGGSALVGFQQSGTGAVATTVQSKLREAVSVKDFGAVGDWNGTTGTDDTAAFVACREHCRANGVKMRIPAGKYRLTASFYFGNTGTGFPYGGFDVEGDGPNATELVLDFNASIGVDLNPGPSGGWQAFSRSRVGGFKVFVPSSRTINNPFRVINAYNNNFHDIHVYVPLASVTSNFTGFRVSGACYFNTFRNIWVEVSGGDATVGKAFYVGNGLYDVGSAFANTSVNNFLNCRTRGFGVGFDTVYANSITYQSCDAEVCGVGFRDLASGWNQYNNCWTEGMTTADFLLDASTYLNADGSTAASTSSRYISLIGPMFTGVITLNSVFKPRLVGVYYNTLNIAASCIDARIDATGNDTGTITGAGNHALIERRKTTPVDHHFVSLGNKNYEWEFTSTSGARPTSIWAKQNSSNGGFNFYRDDGGSAYHGGRVEGDVNGGITIYGWRNQAMGSESLASYLVNMTTSATRFTNVIRPTTDNGAACGESSGRWSVVYAATGTINTSDEREKQQIKQIDAAAIRAWAKVEYCQFKFNDAVEKKGDGARWHFGLIAQRVKEAFESEGLNAFEYGVLCYDEWDDHYETVVDERDVAVFDDEGKPMLDEIGEQITVKERYDTGEQRLVMAAGSRYGVRYEEALALECAYLRSRFV